MIEIAIGVVDLTTGSVGMFLLGVMCGREYQARAALEAAKKEGK